MNELTKNERKFLALAGLSREGSLIGCEFVWTFDDCCYPETVLRSTIGSIQVWDTPGCIIIVPSTALLAGNFGDITHFYFSVEKKRWSAILPARQITHKEGSIRIA